MMYEVESTETKQQVIFIVFILFIFVLKQNQQWQIEGMRWQKEYLY